jgi:hypothetical protein
MCCKPFYLSGEAEFQDRFVFQLIECRTLLHGSRPAVFIAQFRISRTTTIRSDVNGNVPDKRSRALLELRRCGNVPLAALLRWAMWGYLSMTSIRREETGKCASRK